MPVLTVNIRYSKLIDVTEQICDKYCKYPSQPGTQEELNDICDKCPLNNIMHDDEPEQEGDDDDDE